LREKVAEGRMRGGRDRKPSDSKIFLERGLRRDAAAVDPSSGPSDHLLPQGEEAIVAAVFDRRAIVGF